MNNNHIASVFTDNAAYRFMIIRLLPSCIGTYGDTFYKITNHIPKITYVCIYFHYEVKQGQVKESKNDCRSLIKQGIERLQGEWKTIPQKYQGGGKFIY